MSDVMLLGVLRMPPECWASTPLDVGQRHARYLEAADLIEQWDVLSLVEMSRELSELRPENKKLWALVKALGTALADACGDPIQVGARFPALRELEKREKPEQSFFEEAPCATTGGLNSASALPGS